MDPFWTALGLTVFAGSATVVGGVMGVLGRRPRAGVLAGALGLSAGVMLAVSFLEIIPKASESLAADHGETAGGWLTMLGFVAGIGLFLLLDRGVTRGIHVHGLPVAETGQAAELARRAVMRARLMRVGLVTAAAMALHNFPEGFATFIGALADPTVGVALALAMAVHNIPEGLAVSAPVREATGSRRKALGLSVLTGLSEPAGALIGYALLAPFLSDTVIGMSFALVAGIMVFICLDKLIPTAQDLGSHRHALLGTVAGMLVMMASLVMMG